LHEQTQRLDAGLTDAIKWTSQVDRQDDQ
jgi:hypothetical protein